jgi:hypothetical protein
MPRADVSVALGDEGSYAEPAHTALVVMGVLVCRASRWFLALTRDAGAEVSGHREAAQAAR